uniref:receptor protein-tyrosine kinase n=1 Tax=Timema californicum TaxID=61474 RepID=A0A7R9J9V8_TIMCA|nr:unnamed protein product [Timema californicum]
MEGQDVCGSKTKQVKPLAVTSIFNTLFPLDRSASNDTVQAQGRRLLASPRECSNLSDGTRCFDLPPCKLWLDSQQRLRTTANHVKVNLDAVIPVISKTVVHVPRNEGTSVVAVKTLKENANEKERSDLVQELQVMKMLEPHPNVVRLLGCCTEKDPLFVIMEFVPHGKLQSFLRSSRAERFYGNLHGPSNTLTSRDLTTFVYQVARGMEFLSAKGIIHRDLAARNVLVGENHVCKVADFGFARDVIANHVYERKSEGRLPIRWMAPESLYDNIFSVKSDVWSFGILIWEIVTLGSTPYPGLAAADVMKKVRDGYRLDKPEHCRRELYNIMYYCWDKDAKERPTFPELVQLLEQLLLSETEYIELERFPDHSYYNMVSLSGEKL